MITQDYCPLHNELPRCIDCIGAFACSMIEDEEAKQYFYQFEEDVEEQQTN